MVRDQASNLSLNFLSYNGTKSSINLCILHGLRNWNYYYNFLSSDFYRFSVFHFHIHSIFIAYIITAECVQSSNLILYTYIALVMFTKFKYYNCIYYRISLYFFRFHSFEYDFRSSKDSTSDYRLILFRALLRCSIIQNSHTRHTSGSALWPAVLRCSEYGRLKFDSWPCRVQQ